MLTARQQYFHISGTDWHCLVTAWGKPLVCCSTTFPCEKLFLRLFFLCSFRMKTLEIFPLYIFQTLKISQNNPEIANLEFENHVFHKNHVFLPTKEAGTNVS